MLKKISQWFVIGLVFFAFIRVAANLVTGDDVATYTNAEKLWFIIGSIVMIHLVLAVHELGHLLVGLWQGFRFELFVVGLLGIKREDERIKVYLNTNLGYYGGVAGTSPVDGSPQNAAKFARVLLAGPLTSIIFAFVCIGIALLIGHPLKMVFFLGSLTSIAIFFATTVPEKTGMFFTDRKRYQRLMTPGKDQDVELALLNIMGSFAKDDSYRNINPADIRILLSDDTPFLRYFGLFNLVCIQIETEGHVEEAVMQEYTEFGREMPRYLVAAFDKELEKFKERLNV